MNKKTLIIFSALVLILVLVGVYALTRTQAPTDEEIHIHAAFQLYLNDQLIDFSDFKYMHIKNCTLDGSATEEDPQIEKAHLHDNIGDVVHVHREQATWGDLFFNIKYTLPKEITAYVNEVKVADILNMEIEPYDQILIYSGTISDLETKLKSLPSIDYVKEIETRSESCGT